jgi:hypothetical protein
VRCCNFNNCFHSGAAALRFARRTKKRFETGVDVKRLQQTRLIANVAICVRHIAWCINHIANSDLVAFAVDPELELAASHNESLVLIAMKMQRRPAPTGISVSMRARAPLVSRPPSCTSCVD